MTDGDGKAKTRLCSDDTYEFFKSLAKRTPDREMSGADFEALMFLSTHDDCCGERMQKEAKQ